MLRLLSRIRPTLKEGNGGRLDVADCARRTGGQKMHVDVESTEADLRVAFKHVAAGDTQAFSRLYDQLANASYSVCTEIDAPGRDRIMLATWMFVWVNAASLYAMNKPVEALVLSVARDVGAAGVNSRDRNL